MSGRHAANSSKKPLIIVICAVVLVALIAGAVILFMNFSGKNDNSATTVPTSAISTTSVNTDSTQNISDSASEPTQPATESGVTSQEPTEQGFTSESSDNDSEIVVPTISGEEQKPKFSATLVPYYAKDENSSEEVSLRDLFGSAYSGGGFTFNEDGTFIDGITNTSANSGAYIVEGDNIIITYSNDKNVIAAVTEWNGNVPKEFTVNFGGITVSFK
ncbi:hypothetical protein [Ruminococcus bromii]|uniref:hypothetical protein n=1 Tax=Ruminococcus bromii TaxID=40518 RepID=UPI003A90A755